MTEAEAEAVREAILSGWITTGPRTKLLEKRVSEFLHAGPVVCLNSCTAALELSLRVLGVGPGDEVIIPAYTYTASASVVAHVGATVVMVDSREGGLEMDYDRLASAVNERTKVIMPVDIAGVCSDVDAVMRVVTSPEVMKRFRPASDIQRRLGRIAVCVDCAHSFGASRGGRMAGTMSDFAAFSFHAVKNLTTGEGGAMVWNLPFGNDAVSRPQEYCGSPVPFIEGESWNDFIYRLVQLFSLHGQSKDALAKTQIGCWEYDIIGPWYKCNMTDVVAAVGLCQLDRYPELLEKRYRYVARMNERIDALNALGRQQVTYLNHRDADHCSSHHLYIMRLPGRTREETNEVIVKMGERGVATNVHYKPLPMMTAYRAMGFDIADYPNAYRFFENTMSLPLYTRMPEDDLEYVLDNFIEVVSGI